MVLALPDSTDVKSRTVELNNLFIMGDNGSPRSIETQKFKKSICDIPWTFAVSSSSVAEGLRMRITCRGAKSFKNWKLTVSRLLVKFEYVLAGQEAKEVTKSVEQRIFDIDNQSTEVILTREEILHLIPEPFAHNFNFLSVFMTVDREEYIETGALKNRYDFRTRTGNSSLIIDVGSERFFVNMQYLAQMSEYFSALCRNTAMVKKDEETGLWLLKLDDIDSAEFEQLLYLLYPLNLDLRVNHKNIEGLLKLVDRFQCGLAQSVCAELMVDMKKISVAKLISLCEMYNLEWNVANLLDNRSPQEIRGIVKEPEFQTYSRNTMKLIVIRLSKSEEVELDRTLSETGSSNSRSSFTDSVASDVIG